MSSAIPCAVLMCHAPIVVPEVGGRRSADCAATTAAMGVVARRLVDSAPDVIVVITPHGPRRTGSWGVLAGPLGGDFGRFGAPHVAHQFAYDAAAAAALRDRARDLGLDTYVAAGSPLDHGALVPLHFVARAGWLGPTLIVSLPWPGSDTEARMGQAIAAAASGRGERWSVLASGDMSHRLIPGAPSGYHPGAKAFDEALVAAIDAGDLRRASAIDADLRDLAAEDAVDSIVVAAGAVGWDNTGHERLAYEGPFGVGYMEAVLHRAGA